MYLFTFETLKMVHPRTLFRLCLSFQTNITILTTNKNVEKCPYSRWSRGSNPWPLEHESPPITTRPRLLPKRSKLYVGYFEAIELAWEQQLLYKICWSLTHYLYKTLANAVKIWEFLKLLQTANDNFCKMGSKLL